jgi:hypothetical protein
MKETYKMIEYELNFVQLNLLRIIKGGQKCPPKNYESYQQP